jgi:chromosome partitioning protein
MNNAIAVMNTKGGVGKSTMVLGLAETLSVYEGKSVLVIDSDAQASVSSMLMSTTRLYELQSNGLTLVEYLVNAVLNNQSDDVSRYLVPGVSDVDDAVSVSIFPSDVQLTLFEREVSHEQRHTQLRKAISELLNKVRPLFDIVLIDCPPGLSVLTESWLREADYHLTPTKPDYISSCGLEVFRRFKSLNPEMGFAENLGVVVNMKDRMSPADDEYHKWLASEPDNRCFDVIIPRASPLQDAARFQPMERSYAAKYPGDAGRQMRSLVTEIQRRLADGLNSATTETAAELKTDTAPEIEATTDAKSQEPAASTIVETDTPTSAAAE